MFTIEYVNTPVYINQEKTAINCTVKFSGFDKEHPYCATSNDTVAHGKALYDDLIAGKYGEIGDYVAPLTPPKGP
jgi:hypothetical protein